MLRHRTYETEKEELAIIAEMEAQDFTQVSTEGLFVGYGHLLFDDGKPEPETKPPRNLGGEIDELKARLDKLEVKPLEN